MNKKVISLLKKQELIDKMSFSKIEKYADSVYKINNLLLKNNSINKKEYIASSIMLVLKKLYSYELKNIPKETWLYNDYLKFLNKKNILNKKNKSISHIADLYCEDLFKKLKISTKERK